MNRQQAIEFINAMNLIQAYVPPILYSGVINSEVSRLVIAIANSQATCQVQPQDAVVAPPPKGNGVDHVEAVSG